jgi:hypothetical protein
MHLHQTIAAALHGTGLRAQLHFFSACSFHNLCRVAPPKVII